MAPTIWTSWSISALPPDDRFPEADVLALEPEPGLQREPHPLGHLDLGQLLELGEALAMRVDLGLGERRRVGAEEELQEPGVVQLPGCGSGIRPPGLERVVPGRREPVDP